MTKLQIEIILAILITLGCIVLLVLGTILICQGNVQC